MAGQIVARGKGTWLIRVFLGRDPVTGKREYDNKTIHGNKKDAEQKLTEMLRDRDQGNIAVGAKKRTIDVLLDDLLQDYRINGKRIDWAEMVVEKHLRDGFGKIPISKLATDHLNGYITERKAAGIANATINRELALLRRAFNLGRVTTPPKVARMPRFQLLKENNVRKGFFEHDAYLKLRQELPPELRPVLTFAYYTGCRRGEILSLQWSQIDLDARMVRLEPGTTKNDEARNIPLSLTPELLETIKMQKSARDQKWPESPWVFSREGKRILSFKNRWSASCERAELSDKLFHDLRRTGVRNLVRAGVPEKVAMRISGHKTRAVFDRYNIVNEADLQDAARRLTDYMAHKSGASDELAHNRRTTPEAAPQDTSVNPAKLLN